MRLLSDSTSLAAIITFPSVSARSDSVKVVVVVVVEVADVSYTSEKEKLLFLAMSAKNKGRVRSQRQNAANDFGVAVSSQSLRKGRTRVFLR